MADGSSTQTSLYSHMHHPPHESGHHHHHVHHVERVPFQHDNDNNHDHADQYQPFSDGFAFDRDEALPSERMVVAQSLPALLPPKGSHHARSDQTKSHSALATRIDDEQPEAHVRVHSGAAARTGSFSRSMSGTSGSRPGSRQPPPSPSAAQAYLQATRGTGGGVLDEAVARSRPGSSAFFLEELDQIRKSRCRCHIFALTLYSLTAVMVMTADLL